MTDNSAILTQTKRYMTMDQVCEYLSCSRWTIYRLIDRREIPFFAIGKRCYRFDQDAIDSWVKNKTMKTVEDI